MTQERDSLLRLSAAPQMLDLGAEVEPDATRRLHGFGEAPGRDSLLDGLMRHSPFASQVRRGGEAAGVVDRAQRLLHGGRFRVVHGVDGITQGCILTTRPGVGSIQPMTTRERTITTVAARAHNRIERDARANGEQVHEATRRAV
jgi:hypothetical protein